MAPPGVCRNRLRRRQAGLRHGRPGPATFNRKRQASAIPRDAATSRTVRPEATRSRARRRNSGGYGFGATRLLENHQAPPVSQQQSPENRGHITVSGKGGQAPQHGPGRFHRRQHHDRIVRVHDATRSRPTIVDQEDRARHRGLRVNRGLVHPPAAGTPESATTPRRVRSATQ